MKKSEKILEIIEKRKLIKNLEDEVEELRKDVLENSIEETGFPRVDRDNPLLCKVEYEEERRYGKQANTKTKRVIDKAYVIGYTFYRYGQYYDVPVPILKKVKKDGTASAVSLDLGWLFIPESIELYPIQ